MVFSTLKLLSALFVAGCSVEQIPIWSKNDPNYRGKSLAPQQALRTGQYLMSENCLWQFILEADGGLRLYKNVAGQRAKMWSADTSGSTAHRELWFQGDNNLVLYEYSGVEPNLRRKSVWSSGQDDDDVFPVTLVMQNDGNVVHYVDDLKGNSHEAVWHTDTWDDNIEDDVNACFVCSQVVIEELEVGEPIDQPENLNVFESHYDNCGNDKSVEIKQTITHSKKSSKKEHYSFSKSFSETFSNSVGVEVGFSSTMGVTLEGVLSAERTSSASVSASWGWSETRSSTSAEDMTTTEENFSSTVYTIPLTVPANKQVAHYVSEFWGNSKVEWAGWAVCYDKNLVEVERQWMKGMFHSSQYSRWVTKCDMCDNSFSSEDTGCSNRRRMEASDNARRLLESSMN